MTITNENASVTEAAASVGGYPSAADALFRFFTAFPGFDEAHPLGFEAEMPGERYAVTGRGCGIDGGGVMAAVFRMEPTLTQVRRYINGGGISRGACTVLGRVRDEDAAGRREAVSFFSALAEYVRLSGERYEDGGRVFVIRPAAHPARVMLTADGAVWELRCAVEIHEA